MTAADLPPAPPPLTVRLTHAEVMGAAIASRSRRGGSSWWHTIILVVLIFIAITIAQPAAFILIQYLSFDMMFALGPWLPTMLTMLTAFACVVAVGLANWAENHRARRAYLRSLAAVGAPLERDGTYTVTDDALVLETERTTIATRWAALDTIEQGEDGWVLSADQLHMLIPFAAFPEPDAQRPLITAMTARMTPEARARSRHAVEFAAVDGGHGPAFVAPPAPDDAAPEWADVPQARGWLTQDQATWAAGLVYGRAAHARFHLWAYPLLAATTGLAVGWAAYVVLALLIPRGFLLAHPEVLTLMGYPLLLAGAVAGLVLAWRRLGIVQTKAWRAELEARGVPDQVEASWRLSDAGVHFDSPRFSAVAPYRTVHQVLHEAGYWIIASDTLTLCIPDGAFADPASAATFIRALLSRIDDAARARSVAAPD